MVQSLVNLPTLSHACDSGFTDDNKGKAFFANFSQNYTICKQIANFDQAKNCKCAQSYLELSDDCHLDWMTPWVFTVKRDHNNNCWVWQSSSGDSGSASGGYSFHVSGEESDASSGGSDFSGSGNSSQDSAGSMKPGQWVLVVLGVLCLCCCIVAVFVGFTKNKLFKKRAVRQQEYDDPAYDYDGAYEQRPLSDHA